MSRFLSWFKALSGIKKTALIVGVILFIVLLPAWLWIVAALAFLAGIIIFFVALLSPNTRGRITKFRLPGIRTDKGPLALAGTVLAYFLAVSIVFGAVGNATGKLWFPSTEKTKQVAEKPTPVKEERSTKETEEKKAEEPEPEEQEEEQAQGPLATVTRVVDGDTIEVSLNGITEKVRLIGIDTPERGRPYFSEATNKTKELCAGKEVRLEKDVSERDKYGRLLRYVYVGDLFVNAELVKQGFANVYTYPPDVKYSELFTKLAAEARNNKLGLWAATQEVTPAPKAEQKPAVTAGEQVTPPPQQSQQQPASAPEPKAEQPPPPAPAPAQNLFVNVSSVTSPVSPGANATLSAKTLPGASCSITVYYKSGPSEAQGLYTKPADSGGNVSWTWKVGTRTTPGSWDIVVSASLEGQTASASTSFVVQ